MSCLELSCASSSTGAVNQYMTLLFSYLTVSQCSLSNPDMWPKDYGDIAWEKEFEEYDFIIVGAGTAGSVVAGRLSENEDWKILLVEAGGDPPIESAIPAFQGELKGTKYDWGYYGESADSHSLFTENGGSFSRGKMLGGCGSLNGMYYVRGNPDDYNKWEALGNPTWNWDNVLKYFKKTEANQNPEIANAFDGYYHATDGPMSVQLYKENNVESIFNITGAAQEIGFKILNDVNANEHIGFALSQSTTRNGVRESTATAFLSTAHGKRENLHVVKHAQVLDLVIDTDGVVTGVRMKVRGKDIKAFAKKEVILSAGTISTPQILMLSGIGPAPHLEDMNIPVKVDLNVGKNLQDHPGIILVLKQKAPEKSSDSSQQVEFLMGFFTYITDHSGPLATLPFAQPTGFVNVDDPMEKYPNIQYFFMEFQKGDVNNVKKSLKGFGYAAIAETIAAEAADSDILLVYAGYLTEKSRGEILLRSSDPEEKPRIITNLLHEKSDSEALTGAARVILQFLETNTLSERNTELFIVPIPECDALTFDSDEYWECYTRYMTINSCHFAGTCKMGPDSDPEAVVDYRLRVKGTTGLRVIDASIMPVITRGNTNAPTIMIAEKGADFIKEDWNFGTTTDKK